jgi:hypothetical protein
VIALKANEPLGLGRSLIMRVEVTRRTMRRPMENALPRVVSAESADAIVAPRDTFVRDLDARGAQHRDTV